MPHWLITGGAGFIGSNFIRLALAREPEVRITNFDLLTYAGRPETIADLAGEPRYRFLRGDVCDAGAAGAALRWEGSAADAVVHFAAESHVDRSIADGEAFVRTNVQGTQTLLQAARRAGVGRFLQVSTDEVYGSLGREGRFREDSPLAPNSPYAASKAAAELMVRAAVETYGLAAVVTRGSNTYGPFQFPEKLIPLAITHADTGREIPLYGSGDNVRTWIHVDDHCGGILAALRRGRPGAIYNLGGGEETSNRELLERLLAAMGKPSRLIRPVADRPGHDFRYALDCGRARAELGWTPAVRLADGLARTVDWYRGHAAWVASACDREYEAYRERQYPSLASQPAETTAP